MEGKVERWKSLISEAREIYASMTEKECEECDEWLDEEYIKVPGSEIDGTILNTVAMNSAVKSEGENANIHSDSEEKV